MGYVVDPGCCCTPTIQCCVPNCPIPVTIHAHAHIVQFFSTDCLRTVDADFTLTQTQGHSCDESHPGGAVWTGTLSFDATATCPACTMNVQMGCICNAPFPQCMNIIAASGLVAACNAQAKNDSTCSPLFLDFDLLAGANPCQCGAANFFTFTITVTE